MEHLRQYVISVVAAAAICGMILAFLHGGTLKDLLKLICGVFLTFTVVQPLTNLEVGDFRAWMENYSEDAREAAAIGEEMSRESMAQIIKSETEAYILDKAQSLGLQVTAEVELTEEDPPVPCAITLTGDAAPFPKGRLQQIIQEDLNIGEEQIHWIG